MKRRSTRFLSYTLSLMILAQPLQPVIFAQNTSTRSTSTPTEARATTSAWQESCLVCGLTPAPVAQHLSLIQEVLAAIEESLMLNDLRIGSPSYNGVRDSWLFTSFDRQQREAAERAQQQGQQSVAEQILRNNVLSQIFGWLKDNINQKTQTIAAISILMIAISAQIISKDGPMSFLILFQSRPILRDRKKILELDTVMGDFIYQLGLTANYFKKLSSEERDTITKIFIKYSWPTGIFAIEPAPVISSETTYGNMVKFLWTLNSKMKSFIALNQQTQYGKGDKELKEMKKKWVTVTFEETYGLRLAESYACTRSIVNECSAQLANFTQNIKNAASVFADNAGWSWTGKNLSALGQIKQSVEKLKMWLGIIEPSEAFKKQEGRLITSNDPLKTLDCSTYHFLECDKADEAKRLSERGIGKFIKFRSNVQLKKNKQALANKQQQLAKKTQPPDATDPGFSANDTVQDFIKKLQWTSQDNVKWAFYDLLRSQRETEQLMHISEPSDITKGLQKQILDYINGTIRTIGDKTQRGTLLYHLNQSCQLQCTNKWGANRCG